MAKLGLAASFKHDMTPVSWFDCIDDDGARLSLTAEEPKSRWTEVC